MSDAKVSLLAVPEVVAETPYLPLTLCAVLMIPVGLCNSVLGYVRMLCTISDHHCSLVCHD
jgi:hypothetical protein